MRTSDLANYKRALLDCEDALNRVNLHEEEGYTVRFAIFSANLTNFLPEIPQSEHAELFKSLLTNLAFESFERNLLQIGDFCDVKGNIKSLKSNKTPSGLNYVIVKEGDGVKPVAGNMVSVHYVGKLLDGKEFDSSYKNPQSGGKPVDFPIGQGMVIPGWEEGIMNMKKGGKSTFIIPSSLAYGEAGSPGTIPPNSVLVFDVELVDVKNAPKQQ